MKKNKGLLVFYLSMISVLMVSLTLSATMALYRKSSKGNGSYGEIALRSYFERGTGTKEDPYVITRPRHMYNLSRLQGLGVFGEKKYFQLGLVDLGGVDSNGVPMCYVDETSEKKPYLDMSNSTYSNNPINAIGSELLPFYGEFDGQNVEIKNLNVFASPEDAGLFGYTAHGSKVHNLFLSNVNINAMGYTSSYSGLYSQDSALSDNVSFNFDLDTSIEGVDQVFNKDTTANVVCSYYANSTSDFNYNSSHENNSKVPIISIVHPNDTYSYSTLLTGDLIKLNSDGSISPNLEMRNDNDEITGGLFKFFGDARNNATDFPLQASSVASIIASTVDNYGIKHSKVLLTLEFDFTLDSLTSEFIRMNVMVGTKHHNNIGLVIGHCDGSISDCYVYNGAFKMNNGDDITSATQGTYHMMENGSNLGLIGLVGNTVHNIVAANSDAASQAGKVVGVLDFTTVYKDIINSRSFTDSGDGTNGVNYVPISTSKYLNYLRVNTSGNYRTLQADSVSFKGREVIANTDLGVFTIVTDYETTGTGSEADYNLDNSVVLTEDLTVDDTYYLYYTTGEYQANSGIAFSKYRDSFNSTSPSHLIQGYHFPDMDQVSDDSFDYRDIYHNYNIRFALQPSYRANKGFYFSDLDTTTDPGAYLAKYFHHRLVDQNNDPIAIGSGRCGVMLRNSLGQEISSLSASFATTDLSHKSNSAPSTLLYSYTNQDDELCASNSINFKISTDYANVTIVAAAQDESLGAAVGVYKMDDTDFAASGRLTYFNQDFESPDYAFFIPSNDRLAYFDYKVNTSTNKGQIGTYDSSGNFTAATTTTNATIAQEYGKTEYGYTSGKTRLFAHTFKLPRGRYCVESPTGESADSAHSTAKIFYLCAQGQNDGQLDFSDNIFGSDVAENVDFIKQSRFASDGSANIDVNSTAPTTYDSSDDRLLNQRLYVAMVNSDRSTFDDIDSDIYFTYDSSLGKFLVTSNTIAGMTHVAFNNYNHSLQGDKKVLTISLFGTESTENTIAYTYST